MGSAAHHIRHKVQYSNFFKFLGVFPPRLSPSCFTLLSSRPTTERVIGASTWGTVGTEHRAVHVIGQDDSSSLDNKFREVAASNLSPARRR
jgi:hypothetical protein